MEMTGEFRIPAPRERVWQALNDPETLKRAIPGCETIEKLSDTEFSAKVVAKVGPVRASFGGKVNLTDLDPPKAYTISGEGSGGVAGFAKGSAKVKLDEAGSDATVLHYEVQAHVGGKLAQIGSRLIDATSRKMADDFFGRFAEAVSPAERHAASPPETAAAQPTQSGTSETMAVAPSAPQPPGLSEELQHPEPPLAEEAAPASEAAAPGERAAPGEGATTSRLSPVVWVTALTAAVAGMLYYFTRKNGSR